MHALEACICWLLSSLTAGSFKVHGEWKAHVNEILLLHLYLTCCLFLHWKNHSLTKTQKAGDPYEPSVTSLFIYFCHLPLLSLDPFIFLIDTGRNLFLCLASGAACFVISFPSLPCLLYFKVATSFHLYFPFQLSQNSKKHARKNTNKSPMKTLLTSFTNLILD